MLGLRHEDRAEALLAGGQRGIEKLQFVHPLQAEGHGPLVAVDLEEVRILAAGRKPRALE